MKEAYSHIEGLQETALGETLTFNVSKGTFVQILNVGRNHWITVTSLGCEGANHVIVYDSLPRRNLEQRLREQIAAIIYTNSRDIRVTIPTVQHQNGSKDCGLFALAFAMSVCSGQNPGSLGYIQDKLRSHHKSCLEKRYLSCFPTQCRARSCSGPSVEIRFPVFC
uniref:Ubiquitin-like protease family profile domain-containing protein n=1 Tax=Amphimedon queenslandica TaxID=400682 RepID=A0A1X7V770_AMPQE